MSLSLQASAVNSLLILCIFNFNYFSGCQADYVDVREKKREPQDAWIWPGLKKIGIHLTFSESTDWSDIWELRRANGFLTVGRICVRGSFIMYDEPNFQVNQQNGYEVISGNIKCVKISENTKSIQLVGSMGHMFGPSITFFEKVNFGSVAFPTVVNVGSQFFEKMTSTHSAIIVGQIAWTIQLPTGERFCLKPDFDGAESKPICMIKDFSALLETGGSFPKIEASTQGCKDIPEASIYKIQDCQYWGRPTGFTPGNLLVLDEPPKQQQGRAVGAAESPADICSDQEKSKKLFQLYKFAITQDSTSMILVNFPKVGMHAWKLQLLESIFSLAMLVIPDEIIPADFLSHTQELFIDKLVTQWNKPGSNDSSIDDREWFVLNELTTDCVARISGVLSFYNLAFRNAVDKIRSEDDFVGRVIDSAFVRRPDLNLIIETAWVVGHLVGFLCHGVLAPQTSYWVGYFKMFQNLYLEPLKEIWREKPIGLSIIFGGINYKLEYNKLSIFATMARQIGYDLDPLVRPL